MMNPSNRNLWVDNLRSAITVLVVAHHSSLAYTTFAKFDSKVYIHSTCPIVDTQRWIGLDIFQNFNDVFFMSLMFFIGGLFLIKSIHKKGAINFLKDRFFRLFIPFLFLGTLLMLIAYFPSYYVAYRSTHIIAYIKDFFIIEKWPVGPPWFIWVLFLFNLLFALFHSFFQKVSGKAGVLLSKLKNKPFAFFLMVFCVTFILYVPIAYNVGAGLWTGVGPFDFQLSRIVLYFGYFTSGIFIGNTDFNGDIFSAKSAIVKNWWLWMLLSLTIYFILTISAEPLTQLVNDGKIQAFNAWMIYYGLYTASCASSCIAFITIFRKLFNTGNHWLNSLSGNAYLIYLVHYVFVIWCQFFLMNFNVPVFVKFMITFMVALALSWMVSSVVRKIPIVNRYL